VLDVAAASITDALTGADLVILAAPPLAYLDLLELVAADQAVLGPAVVTDVASTRRRSSIERPSSHCLRRWPSDGD
jgi:prephenate dehydrogenase